MDWLSKHWRWGVIVFLVIVALAAWVTATSKHPVSEFIIEFFKTWSPALSAAAVLFLAIAAFAEIRQSRQARAKDEKIKALERTEAWVNSLTQMLSQASLDEPRLSSKLLPFFTSNSTVVADAIYFDKKFQDLVIEVTTSLAGFMSRLQSDAKYEELVDTGTKLGTILNRLLMAVSAERSTLRD